MKIQVAEAHLKAAERFGNSLYNSLNDPDCHLQNVNF